MELDFGDFQREGGGPEGSPEFRKDFQPEGGDPEGSPECRKDFQPEGGDLAGRQRFAPHALRAGGTVADVYLYIYPPPCPWHAGRVVLSAVPFLFL